MRRLNWLATLMTVQMFFSCLTFAADREEQASLLLEEGTAKSDQEFLIQWIYARSFYVGSYNWRSRLWKNRPSDPSVQLILDLDASKCPRLIPILVTIITEKKMDFTRHIENSNFLESPEWLAASSLVLKCLLSIERNPALPADDIRAIHQEVRRYLQVTKETLKRFRVNTRYDSNYGEFIGSSFEAQLETELKDRLEYSEQHFKK